MKAKIDRDYVPHSSRAPHPQIFGYPWPSVLDRLPCPATTLERQDHRSFVLQWSLITPLRRV